MKIKPRQHRPHFRYTILRLLFDLSECILRPFSWSLHEILGPCIPTTQEKERPAKMWLIWLSGMPLYLAVFAVFSLPALATFCLKNILHQLRDPFIISYRPTKCVPASDEVSTSCFYYSGHSSTYSAVTANVCLCPGVASKFNNLSNPKMRAKIIGERIFVDQTYYRPMVNNQIRGQSSGQRFGQRTGQNDSSMRVTRSAAKMAHYNDSRDSAEHVITRFPHTDFLCLQETYDRESTKLLVGELHKIYPWIVYDVGRWGPLVNRCGYNSGLMVASRYEILEVDFKLFQQKKGVCNFISTGLLMVKVLLEEGSVHHNTRRKVGYVFNTHLQPFQGTEPIIDRQMNDVLVWTARFRHENTDPEEEVILDILCGDFNTDNMSPADVHLSDHQLFQVYTDVGRERPGKDTDWAVGTEMRILKLKDDVVSTPEGLKTVLQDPYLRQQYILDADIDTVTMESIYKPSEKTDVHGNVILSPAGGKRRVDFVLHKTDLPVNVQSYNFVTRLAGLTDHVPVSMTFYCK